MLANKNATEEVREEFQYDELLRTPNAGNFPSIALLRISSPSTKLGTGNKHFIRLYQCLLSQSCVRRPRPRAANSKSGLREAG